MMSRGVRAHLAARADAGRVEEPGRRLRARGDPLSRGRGDGAGSRRPAHPPARAAESRVPGREHARRSGTKRCRAAGLSRRAPRAIREPRRASRFARSTWATAAGARHASDCSRSCNAAGRFRGWPRHGPGDAARGAHGARHRHPTSSAPSDGGSRRRSRACRWASGGPVASEYGLHLVRVERARRRARPPRSAKCASIVKRDWHARRARGGEREVLRGLARPVRGADRELRRRRRDAMRIPARAAPACVACARARRRVPARLSRDARRPAPRPMT